MSEAVILAIIGGINAVTLAIIGIVGKVIMTRLNTVKADAAATKDQVVNHHTTNFREENDERHEETRRWFRHLSSRLDDHSVVLETLQAMGYSNRKRIASLEDTERIERNEDSTEDTARESRPGSRRAVRGADL